MITGRVNHAANENNVLNALVCFSRTASKRGGRNATRGVSKPRTVIRAVIRFPRGSHNNIKLNTTGSHDHICKHTSSMNTWNVCEERGRRGPSAHRSRRMEAFRVKNLELTWVLWAKSQKIFNHKTFFFTFLSCSICFLIHQEQRPRQTTPGVPTDQVKASRSHLDLWTPPSHHHQ